MQCLLNRIAYMQQALDNQVVGNIIENLTQEVLEDNLEASIGQKQVLVRPSRTRIVFPSSLVGIATDSEKQLSLPLDHSLFPNKVAATILVPQENCLLLGDEVVVGALANKGSTSKS